MLQAVKKVGDLEKEGYAHGIEWVLSQPVVDYLCHVTTYTTWTTGKRALAMILRTREGVLIVRRVTSGRVRQTQKLHNWLEAYIWLDMEDGDERGWWRDLDEEEEWRKLDREALVRKE